MIRIVNLSIDTKVKPKAIDQLLVPICEQWL